MTGPEQRFSHSGHQNPLGLVQTPMAGPTLGAGQGWTGDVH